MNNEEKILSLLEQLTEKIDKQGEVLAEHSRILNEHSRILNEHSRILNEHSKILAEHSKVLNEHSETLAKYGEVLAEHGRELETLNDRTLRTAIILENDVQPKLQLLYEGHSHLRDTLVPTKRVEVLEKDVDTLKSAMKLMVKRLDALEKAQ